MLTIFSPLLSVVRRRLIQFFPAGPLRDLMKSVYWALPVGIRGMDPATDLIRALAGSRTPIRFVQIGANDGSTGDYLTDAVLKHRWTGVMVEPHPDSFAKLSGRFGGFQQITLANLAIGEHAGIQPFYYLPCNSLVASFNKEHVQRFVTEGAEVESVDVQCETMMGFLQTFEVMSIDLLAIDTEGYDGQILRSIDFNQFDAQAILFETVHLSGDEKEQSFRLLAKHGFELLHGAYDSVAVKVPNRHSGLEALLRANLRDKAIA
ncbi:MAG: FkbM family methyltransferase [Planctomycetaceae bacterium]